MERPVGQCLPTALTVATVHRSVTLAWLRDLKVVGSKRSTAELTGLQQLSRALTEPAVVLRGDDVLDCNAPLRVLLGLSDADSLEQMRWSEVLDRPWPPEPWTLPLGVPVPDGDVAALRSADGTMVGIRLVEVAAVQDCRVFVVKRRVVDREADELMRVLPRLSRRVASADPSTLADALSAAASVLGAEQAWIGRVHQLERSYRVESCVGTSRALAAGQCIELDDLYCAMALEADGAVAVHHMSAQALPPHRCYEHFGVESYLGAPIYVDGHVYGTLAFASCVPREEPWSVAQAQFVRTLAGCAGRAVEATQMLDELREARVRLEALSRLDPVTGILNRRSILEVANREVLRSRRYRGALTLAQIRIDDFSEVNRRIGAVQADQVLKEVGRAVVNTLREVDSAGRVAAATFMAVLPSTDHSGAVTAMERILSRIVGVPTFDCSVTARCGLVTAESTDTIEGVLQRLERAVDGSPAHPVGFVDAKFADR